MRLTHPDDAGRWLVLFAGLLVVFAAIVFVPWLNLGRPPPTLSEAVAGGDVDLAASLLSQGADPDEPRVFGLTPLMRAVLRDDAAMARLLIDSGADPFADSPESVESIHIAAQANAVDSLEELLRERVDPESRSLNGMNALDHAAATGSAEVIELLVRQGVDPNARSEVIAQGHGYPRDRGGTPLMIATMAGEEAALVALLDSGADVNATSLSGHNALLVAVWSDQSPQLVQLLIEHGADASVIAACDEACSAPAGNALDWARELDREQLVSVLEQVQGRWTGTF